MKINFYPGCTLKTKAKNLENSAISAMQILGVEMAEIERWNCCGAVYSLTDDDLIHQVAPVRNLIRVKEQGEDNIVTICSMCYNTLARANLLMQHDEEKRDTINRFMDEEIDYFGEVRVLHLLTFLRDEIGWDKIKKNVKVPLNDLKIGGYYGCTLQRPREVEIEPPGSHELMGGLLASLGATVVEFPAAAYCCGSYQVIGNPDAAQNAASIILDTARAVGVDALATSCPLCEFNLGKQQAELLSNGKISKQIPTFYFTQLMAIAFGLAPETCLFELNNPAGVDLLTHKKCIGAI